MIKSNILPDMTPMMEQYLKIKAKHSDKILLYRMGDFYETFLDDAKVVSKALGITLTKRANGKASEVPLAGFPYHALDNYLPRLLQAGHRVAICEQVEDPKKAKGVVKREVVEIISPGTTLSAKVLDQNRNNFLCALYRHRSSYGFAAVDVSTAEFICSEIPENRITEFLDVFQPREIIYSRDQDEELKHRLIHTPISAFTPKEEWLFSYDFTEETVLNHFKVKSLKPFGLKDKPLATIAAGVVLHYLKENFLNELPHLTKIRTIGDKDFMLLDEATRRNLEINATISTGQTEGSLIQVMNNTQTPMGARMIKQLLNQPLIDAGSINTRLDAVEHLMGEKDVGDKVSALLGDIGDLERWLSRLSAGRANARDLNGMRKALETLPELHRLLQNIEDKYLSDLADRLTGLDDVVKIIANAIADNPPLTITEGDIIRLGFNEELDDLKDIAGKGKTWLTEYVQDERKKTGISSLKVGYNRVFGYYIDITRVHIDKVPPEYVRKQTLVNSERYITDELKQYEDKILGAEEKIKTLEYKIFQDIREKILAHTFLIQEAANAVAMIDIIDNFSRLAIANNYHRPEVNDGDELYILNGRHPVVEKSLPPGEDFIANDINMDCIETQIMIITGPNMAGKSTYLRMAGLIVLMGQIGSFVPAEECRIGVVDRIFTRVGASDSLSTGESTFMVEMNETAYILNHATPKSLILLDEIGRGTSTFDGLSIAWAVTEYLHNHKSSAAKTLFATHYHELIDLEKMYPRIKNFNIAVKEIEDQVIFMHKIVPGGTNDSYGIHVGQMAGLPEPVIGRARQILDSLDRDHHLGKKGIGQSHKVQVEPINQMDIFSTTPKTANSPVLQELKKTDINNMTPLEALQFLDHLKRML